MKTDRNGFIDPGIAIFVGGIIVFGAVLFIGGPIYGVWQQSLAGKAELQKAEYTRQVAVLEAQAKMDSAQKLAEAEIIRAGGVAKANQIIGDSLKDNRNTFSICISLVSKKVRRKAMLPSTYQQKAECQFQHFK